MSQSSRSTQNADMTVDIVSDVVCPWCIVGYKQLHSALEATGTSAEIRWHPFELNPDMPPEGENLRDHIMRKYGSTAEQSRVARERLTDLGAGLGFTFNFFDDMRMVNTFKAHQLLHWASAKGQAHDLKMALFQAYFHDGTDVSDPETLARLCDGMGLDGGEAIAVMADGRFAAAVREEQRFWTSNGIQGVPAMIFDGKHLVTGAQGVETYIAILGRLADLRNEAAAG